MFLGNVCKCPLCPSHARSPPRCCSCLDVLFLSRDPSFPLITVEQAVTHCRADWRKQMSLRYPSKWPSPWASCSVINQKYPFLFVFTIWPGSTKGNYICIHLNITVILQIDLGIVCFSSKTFSIKALAGVTQIWLFHSLEFLSPYMRCCFCFCLQDGTKVVGKCGGYCGKCTPSSGTGLDVQVL